MNLAELTSRLNLDVRTAIKTHVAGLEEINPRGFRMEIDSVNDVFFNPIKSDVIDISRIVLDSPIEISVEGQLSIMYKTGDGGASSKRLYFFCRSLKATFDRETHRFRIEFGSELVSTYY